MEAVAEEFHVVGVVLGIFGHDVVDDGGELPIDFLLELGFVLWLLFKIAEHVGSRQLYSLASRQKEHHNLVKNQIYIILVQFVAKEDAQQVSCLLTVSLTLAGFPVSNNLVEYFSGPYVVPGNAAVECRHRIPLKMAV